MTLLSWVRVPSKLALVQSAKCNFGEKQPVVAWSNFVAVELPHAQHNANTEVNLTPGAEDVLESFLRFSASSDSAWPECRSAIGYRLQDQAAGVQRPGQVESHKMR